PVNWHHAYHHLPTHHADLPTYAFQHHDYWLNSQPTHHDTAAEAVFIDGMLEETEMNDGQPLLNSLALLPGHDRLPALVTAVRSEASAVLGHEDSEQIGADSALFEIGFSSLTAVELRNRLNVLTGLELPAMLVFDQPTPAMVAQYILDRLTFDENPEPAVHA
ncbi:acyl carrier protein, partial [Micromonospora sp. DT31]|uniref:acyl carrier protein n=1 Tax=Micromonospora sp. DT31 TaxID=3393434 RepID=UPI003CF07E62